VLAAVPGHLTPKAESVQLIEDCSQGPHQLFYLSNMPAPYADHIDASYSFMSRFQAGIYSSRVGMIKPEPEIFSALDALRGSHERPVFIDDSLANIQAARAHGWTTLHYQSAHQIARELEKIGAFPIGAPHIME
jgi:putative hydrolase of the HAD superfamily